MPNEGRIGSKLGRISQGALHLNRQPLDRIFESSVDWISLTCRDAARRSRFLTCAEKLVAEEETQGCDKTPWARSGYEGWQCGGAGYGRRFEDDFVRLSGPMAHEHWRKFYAMSTNCSRLDVQMTVKVAGDTPERIELHYAEAMDQWRKNPHGPTVGIYRGTDGSATLYLGKRVSDKFGRIYDKAAESKLDYYQGAMRYEVELKKHCAKMMAHTLANESSAPAHIVSFCSTFFVDRGCRLMTSGFEPLRLCRPRRRSDDRRRLEWLRTACRGTVKELVASGMLAEVLEALGLDGPTLAAAERQCGPRDYEGGANCH